MRGDYQQYLCGRDRGMSSRPEQREEQQRADEHVRPARTVTTGEASSSARKRISYLH